MNLPILHEIRGCRICADELPLGPRPLVAGTAKSTIVLIGQAPGKAAHESGIPWNDRSGDRLREWLGVDRTTFYDANKFALMPMGFCYPGKAAGGDAPPRPECAPHWHDPFLAQLKRVQLRVFVGQYPLRRYLPDRFDSLTEAVRGFAELLPDSIALPHPSPRNQMWVARNPWFERETLPALRAAIHKLTA